MKKTANIFEAIWYKLNLTFLKLRRYYYRRYAIYDCISIGDYEIIHEYRDAFFEGKLRKNNLEIIPDEFIWQEPLKNARRRYFRMKPFYLSFHFVDKVIIPKGKEGFSIVHDSKLRFEGDCSVEIRTSIDQGALRKAIITIPAVNSQQETVKAPLKREIRQPAPVSPKEEIKETPQSGAETLHFDPKELQRQRDSLFRTISLVEEHFSHQKE